MKALAAYNFLSDLRFYGPILILFLAERTGSFALATGFIAITMITSAVLEIPTGAWSDRIGRVPVLRLAAAAALMAVIVLVAFDSYLAVIAAGVLEGVARALQSGNNQALLYESLAERNRRHEYSVYSGRLAAVFQAALAVSALAGGLIAGFSLYWAVAATIAPRAAAMAVTTLLKEPELHLDRTVTSLSRIVNAVGLLRHDRSLRNVVLAKAVQHGAVESAYELQPVFITQLWPVWAVGVVRAVSHGLTMGSMWFGGRLIRRFGSLRSLSCGQAGVAAVNLLALVRPTVVSPALLSLQSLPYGVSFVAFDVFQQERFTDAERATLGSLGALLASAARAVIVLAAGLLADAHGARVAMLVMFAAFIVVMPLLMNAARKP